MEGMERQPEQLTEEALAVLRTPSARRRIPVRMESLGGVTVYVSDARTACSLRDDDAILTAARRPAARARRGWFWAKK